MILIIGPYSLHGLGDKQCDPCMCGGGIPQVYAKSYWLLPQDQEGLWNSHPVTHQYCG